MFQGGNIALAMAQFLGPKVGAVCVQVQLYLPSFARPFFSFLSFHLKR